MNEQNTYNISFRCYFDSEDGQRYTNHYQRLNVNDLPKWIEAYRFTHPNCLSISVKVWFTDRQDDDDKED